MERDILLFLAGIIVSILGGYFIEATHTPLFKKLNEWRDFSRTKIASLSVWRAKARIKHIENDLTLLRSLIANPTLFAAYSYKAQQSAKKEIQLLFIFVVIILVFQIIEIPSEVSSVPTPTDQRIFSLQVIIFFLILFPLTRILFTIEGTDRTTELADHIIIFETYEKKRLKEIEKLQKVVDKQ